MYKLQNSGDNRNSSHSLKGRKEFVFMNQNQKKLQLNRGLSIALALLVVAAICVTVIAVVSGRRAKPNPSEVTTGTKHPAETTGTKQPEETTKPGDDKPVIADKVTFVSPMKNGNIGKEWSAEIPVFSDTMEDYRVHLGVDIEADAGTPVYAAADGTVEFVGLDPMMGQSVIITHANGYKSVYRNLQTKTVDGLAKGSTVKAGDEIGYVGDTALVEISQSPHLHFEIYQDDKCVNPLSHVTVTPIDDKTNYED